MQEINQLTKLFFQKLFKRKFANQNNAHISQKFLNLKCPNNKQNRIFSQDYQRIKFQKAKSKLITSTNKENYRVIQ